MGFQTCPKANPQGGRKEYEQNDQANGKDNQPDGSLMIIYPQGQSVPGFKKLSP
jgi:hypothetical protein